MAIPDLLGVEPSATALRALINLPSPRLVAAGVRSLAVVITLYLTACAEPLQPASNAADTAPRVYPPAPAAAQYVFERAVYGSADLAAPAPTDFMGFLSGKGGSQQGHSEGLARPVAIAANQGRVYVANALGAAISVFDIRQRHYSKIGDQTGAALMAPVGLSVSRNGELFVADAQAQAVLVYDQTGRYVRRIGGRQWFTRLSNVSVDPLTSRVYALDPGATDAQVRVFDGQSGAHLFDFGATGESPGDLDQAVDLAIGQRGELLVVDGGQLRVQVFDAHGKYLRSIGRPGKQPGEFARPKEITVDAGGLVYVADNTLGTVQVFSNAGHYLYAIGTHSQFDAPGHYLMPAAIAMDTDGRLVLADQWFGKLEVFRPIRHAAAGNN